MEDSQSYGFWFWSNKFEGVLYLLAKICKYELIREEFEVLRQDMMGTNDERNEWVAYEFKGFNGSIKFKLAYDAEYPNEMIHIEIQNPSKFKNQIEFINSIQCMFKNLPLDKSSW